MSGKGCTSRPASSRWTPVPDSSLVFDNEETEEIVEAPTGFLGRVSLLSGVDGEAATTVGPPPVVSEVRGSVG